MSKLHDLYLYGYAIFLWMLTLQIPYVIILFVIYLYKIRKLVFIQNLMILLFICTGLFFIENTKKEETFINDTVLVTDIKSLESTDLLVVTKGKYQYQITTSKDIYQRGDQLKIIGEIKTYPSQTIPFGFNQKTYYQSKNIDGWIKISDIQYINHQFHLFSYRDQLIKKIDDLSSKDLILTLVFDEDQIPKEEKVKLQHAGLIQLLSFSGIHVFILGTFIKKVLYTFNVEKDRQDFIVLLIFGIFFYLQDGSLASTRLFLMQIFLFLNSTLKWRLTKLDGIQIVFFILLIINISYVFHLGFLITYLILNLFELNQFRLMSKTNIERKMISYFYLMLIIIPFQNKISLLWFVLVPMFSMYLVGPMFILSVLTLFFDKLDPLLNILYQKLLMLLNFIEHDMSIIYFGALKTHEIIIYFLFLLFFFHTNQILLKIKRLMILVFVVILPFFKQSFTTETKIYFLDVGQGDSIFVQTPDLNIMIDAYYYTDTFLHDIGILTIDYLILTHNDEDHILNAEKLIDEFNVNTVVLNPYDQYPDYQGVSIMYARHKDSIKHNNLTIDFLGPIDHLVTDNNSSLVFKMTIQQKTILFTGDIEEDAEKKLIETYQDRLKSDMLKVPHHGSITSSTTEFINYVNPDVAIISVGRDNRFDFPSEKIINRYQQHGITIYRTDLHGTIVCHLKEGEEKWSFLLPFPS